MLGLRKKSLHVKFILTLLLTAGIIVAAGFVAAHQLRTQLLRNTAQAIAGQVIAFRSWIAGSGVIWVDNLQAHAPDYLGKASCGNMTIYSKNPALATRELSDIVARSGINARFRVTSDNYRNPKNRPDSFEAGAIHTFKMDLAKTPQQQREFLESLEVPWYRYAVPIKVAKPCLRCHGTPNDAPAEVLEKYGTARGFGYKEGDIRGVITVELPVVSLLSASPLTHAPSLALIIAAFLINFFVMEKLIVKRLARMTAATEKMVHGDLDADISAHYRQNSKDELDKLYHVLDLMRKSVKIAMDKVRKL
jgi:hypothetical protein